jgi:hypothetical protein
MLGIYAQALHPSTRATLLQALGEAVGGRPEIAGALLAALPIEELAGALQMLMEAYAGLLRDQAVASSTFTDRAVNAAPPPQPAVARADRCI